MIGRPNNAQFTNKHKNNFKEATFPSSALTNNPGRVANFSEQNTSREVKKSEVLPWWTPNSSSNNYWLFSSPVNKLNWGNSQNNPGWVAKFSKQEKAEAKAAANNNLFPENISNLQQQDILSGTKRTIKLPDINQKLLENLNFNLNENNQSSKMAPLASSVGLSEIKNHNRKNNQQNNNFKSKKNKKNTNQSSNISIEPLHYTINTTHHLSKYDALIITIPSKLWAATTNSCPNFKHLYKSFMKTKLILNNFRFMFEDQTGQDAKGLSRMVFDGILKVYIDLFFEKIKNNDNFLILKEDVDVSQLTTDTKKLILLANAANAKIYLRIDPELLKLCESARKNNDLKHYFSNEKKEFEHFYKLINDTILNNTFNELNNSLVFLKNKNKNDIIKQYKNSSSAKNKERLIKEIRLRNFAVKWGFKSLKQLTNMCRFLEKIINYYPHSNDQLKDIALVKFDNSMQNNRKSEYSLLKFFDFESKFDEEYIISRVTITLKKSESNIENINIQNIPPNLFELYPALGPFVEYIIGPNSTDENRKKFVQFITGSEYSIGDINIYLINDEIPFDKSPNGRIMYRLPFNNPSTCFSFIYLLKRPASGNYKNKITIERIDDLILQSILTLAANNKY